MGVTRQTLLVFEDMGLLTPAVKDEDSGFRYYSADNIDTYLKSLMDLRSALDKNIQMLQVRAAKQGDLTVRKTTLPRQVCFSRHYKCENIAEAAYVLRDTYIAAAIHALLAYVKENNIETTGLFRSVYMEGPPNRGENAGDYITQITVPIRE